MHSDEWFLGGDGRDELEQVFMRWLRVLAAEELSGHVDAAATTSSTELAPVHLGIDVPSLPDAGAGWPGSLQAAYFCTGTGAGPRVKGGWSLGGYVMDGHGDPGDLDEVLTAKLEGEPEVAARLVMTWLVAQLSRPIERLDWSRGAAGQRSLWRLADSGTELHRSGRWLLRRATEPHGVTAVR